MKIHATFVVAFVSSASLASVARAAESTTCAESYERAQEEKAAGHLKAALVHLKSCVDRSCPKFIRDDCARWMDQAESALPTVVFAARRDGGDLTEVEVSCDRQVLMRALDGKAVSVDPGAHDFSFSVPGSTPIHRHIVVREGEQNRIIDVEFNIPREGTAPPTSTAGADANLLIDSTEPKPLARYLPYGLAGLGALGVTGFALFGITGNSQKADLERTCSPHCQSSQVDDVKTKYILADTCLAVGLVSLGVATYLFLTRHSGSAESRDVTTSIGFAPRTSGGVWQISTRF